MDTNSTIDAGNINEGLSTSYLLLQVLGLHIYQIIYIIIYLF